MNEIQKSTLFNMPEFVIFGFPKNGSKFDIKKYAPRIANSESTVLKSKKLQLTTLVVLGILVYRFISSRYIGKDLKTVKGKMRQTDFGKKFEIIFSSYNSNTYVQVFPNLFLSLLKPKQMIPMLDLLDHKDSNRQNMIRL